MHRSVFLLLISVLVLSAAVALPASLEESQEADLKVESVEKLQSIEAAKDSVSSSEEQRDEVKNSSDSDSAEETAQIDEDNSSEPATRRRRSAEEERYRNLYNLATICPKKDFKTLEQSPLLNVRIEIADMYAVCAQLKDRQPERRR